MNVGIEEKLFPGSFKISLNDANELVFWYNGEIDRQIRKKVSRVALLIQTLQETTGADLSDVLSNLKGERKLVPQNSFILEKNGREGSLVVLTSYDPVKDVLEYVATGILQDDYSPNSDFLGLNNNGELFQVRGASDSEIEKGRLYCATLPKIINISALYSKFMRGSR